jgi:hypothetical protein
MDKEKNSLFNSIKLLLEQIKEDMLSAPLSDSNTVDNVNVTEIYRNGQRSGLNIALAVIEGKERKKEATREEAPLQKGFWEYVVNSEKDSIKDAVVHGRNVYLAVEKLILLNGYRHLFQTDWNVKRKINGIFLPCVINGKVVAKG